ncbi:MAG: DegT/DnrJ/EryC1/StrS family aminotransferase [Nitrososphaerota archaeon]|nr:DegT/DnrJ/EryC1/StrS family aminotransferase [Nitrososphaerota archaeon]MDG6919345.1 DegT/DnrJ/EryC1/StrS family aminotransferase [Nitrososphaerota archaeon]MDG6946885.1 DegT/DnrJ/EryC1/StrS family aminotransferase [Nitrososphaerota archaeon]
MGFIPVNKPHIGEEEKKAVLDVVSSGMLVNASYEGGPWVREFEGKVKRLLGTRDAVAVNSGTAALHTVLMALGVGPGDEVIVPSFTFLATANVVLACGAKPVFVDIKEDYNMDPAALKKAVTRKTKAVIPVHVYGYPADMDEMRELAAAKSIRVVEDAAESLGATYRGTQTGKLSDAGCFSLYATKVVTSGEGGAISTDDAELADRLRLIRNHGQVHGYDSRCLGYNYRMPEVSAALASVQMDRLEGFLKARAKNAKYLNERLAGVRGAKFTQDAGDRTHVFYLYTLHLRKNREKVQGALKAAGVGSAVYWPTPVHRTPLYKELGYARKKLAVTEDAARHVLSVPCHPGLTEEELETVADSFLAAAREHL